MGNWEIFKIIYVEDNYGNIHKRISECGINVHYETEPPHGDGIYSATLKNKKLPFWIYGRNVVFIAENLIIVESVKYNTFDPITSMIIDIKEAKYASLKDWYPGIEANDDRIELSNRFQKNKKIVFSDIHEFQWLYL